MKLNSKLSSGQTTAYDSADEDAMLWQTAIEAGKQALYILMILGAGVLVILSIMVTIFTMPFREGMR